MSAKAKRRVTRSQRRELKTFQGVAQNIELGWREGFKWGVLAGGGSAAVFLLASYFIARAVGL